ncbi:unnamed protein product [Caenorhabditis brenneri]
MYTCILLLSILFIVNAEYATPTHEQKQVAAWIIVLGVLGGVAVSASIAGAIFVMNRRNANQVSLNLTVNASISAEVASPTSSTTKPLTRATTIQYEKDGPQFDYQEEKEKMDINNDFLLTKIS